MFAIFVLLWIMAAALIYVNPKVSWAWWAGLCLVFNGFGGLAVLLNDNIIPFVQQMGNINLVNICVWLKGISNLLHHYFATYSLVIFVLLFTDFLNINERNFLKYIAIVLLLLPSIHMLAVYPITPSFEPDYKELSAWVVPYTVFANIIMVLNIIKEKDLVKKNQNIMAGIVVIPTTISIMWTSYLSIALGYNEKWYFNIWIIIFEFLAFIILSFKYGLLGVRLRLEKNNLDSTIDAMINGISMISHAIKNEASTISLCVDTIKSFENVNTNTEKKLNIIKQSSKNLTDFTHKINKFRIFEMNLKPCSLNNIINTVIDQVIPSTQGKNIEIINKSSRDYTVMVDIIHISEVLKNLLVNAIEAIENKGTIIVQTELADKNIFVSVTDNGIGISEDSIEKVMTPFYSTKSGKDNFGLGLSYCYKVMKSHKGNIKIKSRENHGTTMVLIFPTGNLTRVNNDKSIESFM